MVDAFREFQLLKPNVAELHIAGTGELEQELLEKIKGVAGIFYRGAIPYQQVDQFIQEAHFLICPSLVETFGMVNAEALMNATPVLGNRVGGIPELVIDGQTGFLSLGMATNEWVQLFSRALDLVFQNPEAYLKMQKTCRQHYSDHLTIEKYLEKMTNLVNQI